MKNIEENWNVMAMAYEDFTENSDSYSYSIEWPCVQKMLPNIKGKSIIDLGCGTGRFTFLLEAEEPDVITGIDLSERMLDIARNKAQRNNSTAIFEKRDLNNLDLLKISKVDFIFSSTTFHYILDLDTLFYKLFNLLNEEGSCIITLMNPVYTAGYPVDKRGIFPSDEDWNIRYLDKSLRSYIQPWIEYNDSIDNYLSSSYHHTFSDYFNAIIKAGFHILQVEEPAPPLEWKERLYNRYDSFIQTPSFLILKLAK